MKLKIKDLTIIALVLLASCSGELEDCYKTVCDGPENTNCREEPVFDSGCFPTDSKFVEETDITP